MKGIFSLLLIFLSTFIAFSQTGFIRGRIMSNGLPVEFANLLLEKTKHGTSSDEKGYYRIQNIPAGNYTLLVSAIGFEQIAMPVNLSDDEEKVMDLVMKETFSTLNAVVVTGTSRATMVKENPVSVALVSPKMIERTMESNIIDALVKNVPGLNSVKTGPNISKPFIRGLGYNRVLTLYDGVRQEGQQWGDEHGIEIDPYNIERAEVIKGPSSLMFGSDALAGVVSMFPITPREKDKVIRGRFLSEYQSNNGLFGNSLRLSYGSAQWRWAVSGSYRKARNYTNPIDGRVYNTGFEEKNLAGLISRVSKKGETRLNFTLYDNLQGIPDGSRDSLTRAFTKQVDELSSDNVKNRPLASEHELSTYELSPLIQHIQHRRIYVNNHYEVGKGDVDILLGFQQSIRREYNHPADPEQAGLYIRLNTLNYGFRYNSPEFSNFELSAGMNGMYQDNKNLDGTDFPIPDYNLLDVGGFGFLKWKKEQWTVSGGIRYDVRQLSGKDFYVRHNPANGFEHQVNFPDTVGAKLQFPALHQTFTGTSLSVGATYQFNNKWSLKMNVARGYRAPNISEIASNGLDPGAHIVYIGNRSFSPEFSFQQDIGVSGNLNGVVTTVSFFNNIVENYIHLSQLADAQGNPIEVIPGNKTFQYQQASAQLYGMEATLEVYPKSVKGTSFNGAFSLVYGNNTKKEFEGTGVNGQYLPFIPPLKIIAGMNQEFKFTSDLLGPVTLRADAECFGNQNRYLALYQTETPTPGYVLFNAGINSEIKYSKRSVIQFQLQVNNIFDVAYQSNLSRLKYFEYYQQSPSGYRGIYGMGRNVCVKLIIPF